MEKNERGATRKNGRHLRVPVLAQEEQEIKRQALSAGLTIAAYLRKLGLGYEIRGMLDYQRVDDLARVNSELERLGGLLKLCLTNSEMRAEFDSDELHQTISGVLQKISKNQDAIQAVMMAVVRS